MMRISVGSLLLSAVMVAGPVYGQGFFAGVAGGVHVADLKITISDPTVTIQETKSRTFFAAGGVFGIRLNDHLSVQLAPMYAQKGCKAIVPAAPEMQITTSQIDIPLLATLAFGETVRPFVSVGTFLSFLVDADMRIQVQGYEFKGEMNQVLKKTEYGILCGAGVSVPVWKGSIVLEGRYLLGLSNVNRGGSFDLKYGTVVADRISIDPKDEILSSGFLIMIGYQLPLSGD